MRRIDQRHKIVRCAKARGRRIIAADLISPGPVERMLRHRHQFNVRIAHVLHIRNQFFGQLTVTVVRTVRIPLPRACMHLIDIHRPRIEISPAGTPAFQPRCVPPLKSFNIKVNRSGSGRAFCKKTIRIRLENIAPSPANAVFIPRAYAETIGCKRIFPDAVRVFHRTGVAPAVKIAAEENLLRVRRPHPKTKAVLRTVYAKVIVRLIIRPFKKEIFG